MHTYQQEVDLLRLVILQDASDSKHGDKTMGMDDKSPDGSAGGMRLNTGMRCPFFKLTWSWK